MTKKEMAERYLASKGYQVVQGELDESLEALLPWLLIDLQHSIYRQHIQGQEHRHKLAQMNRKWTTAYDSFINEVFKPFSEEERVEVVDYMDQLEEYLRNDIVFLELAVMEMVPEAELQVRQTIASGYVCVVLTHIARTVHRKVYQEVKPVTKFQRKTRYFQEFTSEPTPELDAMAMASEAWVSEYVWRTKVGNVTRSEKINNLTNNLCRKAIKWLNA